MTSSNRCQTLMLDTQQLYARVTAPARSKPRVMYISQDSYRRAVLLRDTGRADKAITRILTDALLSVLDYAGSGGDPKLLKTGVERVQGCELTKVQFSLKDDRWDDVAVLAERLDITPNEVVRVACHIAMELVCHELEDR